MRYLIVGLVLGLGAGYGASWLQHDEGMNGGRGARRAEATDPGIVLRKGDAAELERLRELIAQLEADLAAARAAGGPESAPYEVPATEEGIALLEKEFQATGNLDRLLALIEALLLQGEPAYPRLTQLLLRVGHMAMSNRFEEAEAMQRIVPAFRLALRHEQKLVGYIGYLITSDKVPSLMKTPALGAAMFLSMNGVRGSEEFAPKLLEIFVAQADGGPAAGMFGAEQGRMLIDAMGMLQQKEAVNPLLRMLADPKKKDQSYRIVEALGRIGDPAAVGPLVQRLNADRGSNSWWRPEVRALARIGTDEAKAAAEAYIRSLDEDSQFFTQAGAYLREQPTAEMMALVRERFRKNPGAHNMWSTVRALQEVDSPAARLMLEEIAAESTNEQVRQQAVQSLKQLAELQKGFEEGAGPAER
jgi:hypothetical protein